MDVHVDVNVLYCTDGNWELRRIMDWIVFFLELCFIVGLLLLLFIYDYDFNYALFSKLMIFSCI